MKTCMRCAKRNNTIHNYTFHPRAYKLMRMEEQLKPSSTKGTFHRITTIVELLLYLTCVISFIYFGVTGIFAKCLQAVLIVVVLLLFRGLIHWTKSDLSTALRLSVLIFIAITMLFANLFGMYGVIPYLDKLEHLVSGVILVYFGLFIIHRLLQQHQIEKQQATVISIWFSFLFSAAMAGMWEIYEFTVDHLFGLTSQNGSLTDTMLDIICGVIGALAVTIVLFIQSRSANHSK